MSGLTVGVLVGLLAIQAFFVAAEHAVMGARRGRLERRAESGSRSARRCLRALDSLGPLLLCAQFVVTACCVLVGAVAVLVVPDLLHPVLDGAGVPQTWIRPAELVLTLLLAASVLVVVGEIVPKNLALAAPDRAVLVLTPVLAGLTWVLRPLLRFLEVVATGFVRGMGVEPRADAASALNAAEVHEIVARSAQEGLLQQAQHGLTSRAIELADRPALDIAVRPDELVTLHDGATPDDLEHLVARHGFSRYPLLDHAGDLVGYLHLKDVFYAQDTDPAEPIPRKRVRPFATIGPTDSIEDALATMQSAGSHLARVVAPDGSLLGIVFLEDVLEELVGEVVDASQRLPRRR